MKTKKILKSYTTTKLIKRIVCKIGATGLTNELTSLDGKFTVKFAENIEKFAETVVNNENTTVVFGLNNKEKTSMSIALADVGAPALLILGRLFNLNEEKFKKCAAAVVIEIMKINIEDFAIVYAKKEAAKENRHFNIPFEYLSDDDVNYLKNYFDENFRDFLSEGDNLENYADSCADKLINYVNETTFSWDPVNSLKSENKTVETVENKTVENTVENTTVENNENKTVENKEPQAIIKTDYLRELLTMNIEQREKTVSRLCWSKEWVEQYYGYNSDCIINGIMSELITFMWLNSNKFCKYFEVKYGNLFMVEGSKLFKLQNQPDIKIFFEDRVIPAEIKSTMYEFNFNETDKPSMTIPQLINKAHREHAELLFVLDVVNLKLIIVDIINDKFIECCDVKNMYSRLLKVLLDNNSLNRILGLKGHVIE